MLADVSIFVKFVMISVLDPMFFGEGANIRILSRRFNVRPPPPGPRPPSLWKAFGINCRAGLQYLIKTYVNVAQGVLCDMFTAWMHLIINSNARKRWVIPPVQPSTHRYHMASLQRDLLPTYYITYSLSLLLACLLLPLPFLLYLESLPLLFYFYSRDAPDKVALILTFFIDLTIVL